MRLTATKECVAWRGYIIAAGGRDLTYMRTHTVKHVRNVPSGTIEWAPAAIRRSHAEPECAVALPTNPTQSEDET
jgi:hypothetical protein